MFRTGSLSFAAVALAALLLAGAAAYSVPSFALTAEAQELSPTERAALQKQYDQLQEEIAAQQKIVDETRAKKNGLQGDVTALNAQIAAAEAQIKQKNLTIQKLSSQIATKNATITALGNRIDRSHQSLASMLRQQSQLDDYSPVEVALSSSDLSSFFADADSFSAVERSMSGLFSDIRSTKAQTEAEKKDLASKQNQETDAKQVVLTKQQQIAADKTQKQQLLNITANQEAEYQKILAANQAKAAAIRAALFPLRDAAPIKFEDALAFAKEAQAKTGVRPALILAVLTQESNLGQNVGQCYLTNDTTGAGVGKNTGTPFENVMKPTRDVAPFLALATQLGFDPHKQVVSCPIASVGGYGGAMGPAQFIPSTWAGYAARVAGVVGHTGNPWAAEDAIAAMSLYFADLGAGVGGYTAEHTAAAHYYAGGGWAGPAGQSYANQVMAKVAEIQKNIDFLDNN